MLTDVDGQGGGYAGHKIREAVGDQTRAVSKLNGGKREFDTAASLRKSAEALLSRLGVSFLV